MVRRLFAPLIATFVLAFASVGMVFAGTGSSVEITVTGIDGVETFTTSGDVLCPSGTSEDTFERFGGSLNSRAGTFHGYKTLTCADESGTFVITYDAATVFGSPQDQGGWHLVGGTGDYAGCTGGGNLVGIYIEGGIIDHYTGQVQC